MGERRVPSRRNLGSRRSYCEPSSGSIGAPSETTGIGSRHDRSGASATRVRPHSPPHGISCSPDRLFAAEEGSPVGIGKKLLQEPLPPAHQAPLMQRADPVASIHDRSPDGIDDAGLGKGCLEVVRDSPCGSGWHGNDERGIVRADGRRFGIQEDSWTGETQIFLKYLATWRRRKPADS